MLTNFSSARKFFGQSLRLICSYESAEHLGKRATYPTLPVESMTFSHSVAIWENDTCLQISPVAGSFLAEISGQFVPMNQLNIWARGLGTVYFQSRALHFLFLSLYGEMTLVCKFLQWPEVFWLKF